MAQLKVFDIIKSPHASLKAAFLNKAECPQLVIVVDIKATKPDIKIAVKTLFGVEVIRVNTLVMKGKRKRSGGRYTFHSSNFKKAIVTLKPGQDLSNLEGVTPVVSEEQPSAAQEN